MTHITHGLEVTWDRWRASRSGSNDYILMMLSRQHELKPHNTFSTYQSQQRTQRPCQDQGLEIWPPVPLLASLRTPRLFPQPACIDMGNMAKQHGIQKRGEVNSVCDERCVDTTTELFLKLSFVESTTAHRHPPPRVLP